MSCFMATRHDASYFFQNVLAKYKGWFPEGAFIKHPCEGAGICIFCIASAKKHRIQVQQLNAVPAGGPLRAACLCSEMLRASPLG